MIKENVDYELYDSIINATLINIYNYTKGNNINILNFNPKDNKYNYILRVSMHVINFSKSENRKIYLDMSLMKYIVYRIKNRGMKVKRYNSKSEEVTLDTIDLLEYMAKEFNVDLDIFEKIYLEYYK